MANLYQHGIFIFNARTDTFSKLLNMLKQKTAKNAAYY
jgi:hypothetical protein